MSSESIQDFLVEFHRRNVAGLESAGSAAVLAQVEKAGEMVASVLGSGGLLVSAGNGGSMADAMHLAEELSGKYRKPRPALRAVSLSDPTYLTCVGNDFGYDQVFARGCEALVRPGDCAVLYTTSGTSRNVLEAARATRQSGGLVITMTGRKDSEVGRIADVALDTGIDVPTEIAQLIHTMWTHMIIEIVEKRLGYQE